MTGKQNQVYLTDTILYACLSCILKTFHLTHFCSLRNRLHVSLANFLQNILKHSNFIQNTFSCKCTHVTYLILLEINDAWNGLWINVMNNYPLWSLRNCTLIKLEFWVMEICGSFGRHVFSVCFGNASFHSSPKVLLMTHLHQKVGHGVLHWVKFSTPYVTKARFI